MISPIKGNVFTWKDRVKGDVIFTIAEDFSEIKISHGNNCLTVCPSALVDVLAVMRREQEATEDEKLGCLRCWNMLGTTQVCEEFEL